MLDRLNTSIDGLIKSYLSIKKILEKYDHKKAIKSVDDLINATKNLKSIGKQVSENMSDCIKERMAHLEIVKTEIIQLNPLNFEEKEMNKLSAFIAGIVLIQSLDSSMPTVDKIVKNALNDVLKDSGSVVNIEKNCPICDASFEISMTSLEHKKMIEHPEKILEIFKGCKPWQIEGIRSGMCKKCYESNFNEKE